MHSQSNLVINNCIEKLAVAVTRSECVVFCGAGISLNSDLPIIYGPTDKQRGITHYSGLADNILKLLGLDDLEIDIIRNSNLPFELIVEKLAEETNIENILDIFCLGEPNINHFLLAKLAKKGYLTTIFTTNFDTLIEKAFVAEGLVENEDYEVIFRDAAYASLDWDDDKLRLIKLHGSIHDQSNMAITIKKIATQQYDSNKRQALKYLLSKGPHKSVIILGYSCSDVFDISPSIESIRRDHKSIYYVEHRSSDAPECPSPSILENIAKKDKKNPFKMYPGSRIIIDTDEFIKRIWKHCLNEDYLYTPPSNTKESWKRLVEQWSLTADETSDIDTKYHLAALLFWNIAQFELAIKFWEKALQLSVDVNDEDLIAAHTGNIGLAYRDLGDFKKAIGQFNKALRIAQSTNNRAVERRQISNLGATYRILGNTQQAIKWHKKALKIAKDIDFKEGIRVGLGNLGICYDSIGQHKKAVRYYTNSIRIAKVLGNKRGEANQLGNLGITYHKTGEYKLSIKHHNNALSIQQNIGDRLGEGNTYNYRGQVYMSMGDYRHAKQDFRRSLTVLNYCFGSNHKYSLEVSQNLKIAEDIVGQKCTNGPRNTDV